MKKECIKKVIKKIKEIVEPTKKTNLIERRKCERRTADRRWMSKISNEPTTTIHRNGDRRIGDRRKN